MLKIKPTKYEFECPFAGGHSKFTVDTWEDINIIVGTGPIDIDIENMILRDCYITGFKKNHNVTRYHMIGVKDTYDIPGSQEVTIEGIFNTADEQIEVKFKGDKKTRQVWKTDYEIATKTLGKLSKVSYEDYERQIFAERI